MATVDPELEKLRLQKEMAELQYRREKEEREAKLALEKEHTYRMTAQSSGPTIVNNNSNNNNAPSVIASSSLRIVFISLLRSWKHSPKEGSHDCICRLRSGLSRWTLRHTSMLPR